VFIHHTLNKQAAKYGFVLEVAGGPDNRRVEARKVGTNTIVAFDVNPREALNKAIQRTAEAKSSKPKYKPNAKAPPATYAAETARKVNKAVHTRQVVDDKPAELYGTKGEPKTFAVTGNIVKKQYRQAYGRKQRCGDALSEALSGYCNEPTGRGTQTKLSLVKLKDVAHANSVWKDKYDDLNDGQVRMTVGVRLRSLIRHGTDVTIGDRILKGDKQ
jgi:hypothetical protein